MRKLILLLLSITAIGLQAQTLGGVINEYYAVTAIDPFCPNSVTVDNASNLNVNDYVMVMQMKGATIATANNASYGSVTNLNQAGSYEMARVKDIVGNQIYFYADLLNSYDVAGALQLVKFEMYNGATIGSTISALPWDGAKGGVVVLVDSGTLTMNGDIDVSEQGFRGGNVTEVGSSGCSPIFGSSSDYEYPVGSISGKDKGEGIGGIYGLHGRGAAANGGGGGNDHKTGGAGGGNTVAGGAGSIHNDANGFGVACDGTNPGVGGNAISYNINQKVIFGGGGGAGANANGSNLPSGGNGGGIVLLQANSFVTNSTSIIANGETGTTAIGAGAGGGGAAGTVVINAGSQSGILGIIVNGGDGGNSNSGPTGTSPVRFRCWGKGGGGAGGAIFANFGTGATVYHELNGGQPGVEVNAQSTCLGSSSNAQAGNNGTFTNQVVDFLANTNTTLLTDILTISPIESQVVCPGDNATFNTSATSLNGYNLEYEWQLNDGGGWVTLVADATYQNVSTNSLQINSVTTAMHGDSLRCIVLTECREAIDTTIGARLIVNGTPSFDVNDILTPTTDSIECVISGGFWQYFYDNDGELLLGINPFGQNLGLVKIKVTVNDNGPFGTDAGCASGAGGELHLSRYWTIEVQNQPSSTCDIQFFYNQTELDDFQTLTQAQSPDYINCWGTATAESDLMMTVVHSAGNETLSPTFLPGVSTGRMAAFSLDSFSMGYLHVNAGITSNNVLPVELLSFEGYNNNASVVLDWQTATEINNAGFEVLRSTDVHDFIQIGWVAGNGTTADIQTYQFIDQELPQHSILYYQLKQVDENGDSELSEIVSVYIEEETDRIGVIYPNPTSDIAYLPINLQSSKQLEVNLYNVAGMLLKRNVHQLEAGNQKIAIKTSSLAAGTYYLSVTMDGALHHQKLMVTK